MKFKLLVWSLVLGFYFAAPARIAAAETEGKESAAAEQPKKPSVRIIALRGAFQDAPAGEEMDPISLLLGDLQKPGSFYDLCAKIDEIANDGAIQHVLFDVSSIQLHLNLAQLSELQRHMEKLRAAGKRTFAWIENGDTVHYSVAAACDTILMADVGTLDFPSLSLTTLHFRDAMDLLGARASVVRVGDFKGAVEPFTLSEMSGGLRAHYREMLVSMNDALIERIVAGRKLDHDAVRRLQGDRIFSATQAKEAGLVDELIAQGSVRDHVAKLLGEPVNWVTAPKKKQKQPSFFEMMAKLMGGTPERRLDKPAIAVLHMDGQILDGETERPGAIVSGPMVRAISELETEKNIRGVVVRINSPGGSASASEAIRRALQSLAEKKPVCVSMGSMAASGGYWISCLGKPIFAEPGTLTGSIGVFGLKLSFGPLLKRVGIQVESVTLDESASAMSLQRGWTPEEEKRLQTMVDDIYKQFLERVATSRGRTAAEIDPIAGGRVWSGAQALKLGLVDRVGGLDAAIGHAANEAELAEGYAVVHRPRKQAIFQMFDPFGDSPQEIRALISPGVKDALGQSGFNLEVPLELLRQAFSTQAPRVWLLAPTELRIR